MKNITFTAEDSLIEAARERARSQQTTLNEAFREWLRQYASAADQEAAARSVVDHLRTYVRSGGRKFSRDEMNER